MERVVTFLRLMVLQSEPRVCLNAPLYLLNPSVIQRDVDGRPGSLGGLVTWTVIYGLVHDVFQWTERCCNNTVRIALMYAVSYLDYSQVAG